MPKITAALAVAVRGADLNVVLSDGYGAVLRFAHHLTNRQNGRVLAGIASPASDARPAIAPFFQSKCNVPFAEERRSVGGESCQLHFASCIHVLTSALELENSAEFDWVNLLSLPFKRVGRLVATFDFSGEVNLAAKQSGIQARQLGLGGRYFQSAVAPSSVTGPRTKAPAFSIPWNAGHL